MWVAAPGNEHRTKNSATAHYSLAVLGVSATGGSAGPWKADRSAVAHFLSPSTTMRSPGFRSSLITPVAAKTRTRYFSSREGGVLHP